MSAGLRLTLRGVGHSYDEVVALADIDLVAQPGEVHCEGDIADDCLNAFTYVFQDFALLPWRTVEANVALALEHRLGKAERRERVAAALALTGLADFAAAYPKQLSGGMRQRVGIARALVVRPAVLLLDEPLSALDAQTRELLMEDLLRIWARERSTRVYVTHNLEEAARLADRVVVLSRRPGRIREIVRIDAPVSERAAIIPEMQRKLWALIRDEAATADREVQGV